MNRKTFAALIGIVTVIGALGMTGCATAKTGAAASPKMTEPADVPAAPSLPAAGVISLFNSSAVYADVRIGNWNPRWNQTGSISDVEVGPDSIIKLLNLVDYQGIAISAPNGAAEEPGVLDITGKNTLHISYWTAKGTAFNIYPINASEEYSIGTGAIKKGAWVDLEIVIDKKDFDLTTIRQLKMDGGSGKFYLDNIYFH